MKRLFYILFLYTFGLKAQTQIGPIFNERLVDSFVFVKINKLRLKNNLKPVSYSPKLREFFSQKHSQIMINEKRMFHPTLVKDKKFMREVFYISKDFSKANNYDVYVSSDSSTLYSIKEMVISLNNTHKTYEEIANTAVNWWFNSKVHNEIMLSKYFNQYTDEEMKMVIGVSFKKHESGYYGCVNFMGFK